jgi:hypothetical protein
MQEYASESVFELQPVVAGKWQDIWILGEEP